MPNFSLSDNYGKSITRLKFEMSSVEAHAYAARELSIAKGAMAAISYGYVAIYIKILLKSFKLSYL